MAKYTYDSATQRLRQSAANFDCAEMRRLLENLGFAVNRGSNGNHHTFSHPKLSSFWGGNYDCGHKGHMKPVYPRNVLKVLEEYEDELKGLEK